MRSYCDPIGYQLADHIVLALIEGVMA